MQQILLTIGCLLLTVAVALLDYWTGPYLSFGAFYLIPVAACAWYGGLPNGLLLALAATSAWCLVDASESAEIPAAAVVWNGLARFCILALVSSLLYRLHASMGREHRLARTDPLTGAANGRNFYETTAAAAERARLVHEPLTVAYFDLDDFKNVNDRLGHATGDEVLKQFAGTVHLQLHGEGLLARLGGDEFALLLPATDPHKATEIISRLHLKLSLEMSSQGWGVTVSIGSVTFLRPPPDVDRIIQKADKLMYLAKKKGKQRIEYYVVPEEPEDVEAQSATIERRATARILCSRTTATVRATEQEEGKAEFAVIFDISLAGIGIHLPQRHGVGTVLLVEPLSCRAKTVLARVSRVVEEADGWLHGCIMATRLSDEELISWTSSSALPFDSAGKRTFDADQNEDPPPAPTEPAAFCQNSKLVPQMASANV